MGNRVLVLLYTDHADKWSRDPQLGQKIARGMNHVHDTNPISDADLDYGRVVQCEHADNVTLAIIDSYQFVPVSHSRWQWGQTDAERNLILLKEFAATLGYSLRRKPNKKVEHGPTV